MPSPSADNYTVLCIPPDVLPLVLRNTFLKDIADLAVVISRRLPKSKDCQEPYKSLADDVVALVSDVIKYFANADNVPSPRLQEMLNEDIPSLLDEIETFSHKLESRTFLKKVRRSMSRSDSQMTKDHHAELKALRRNFGMLSMIRSNTRQEEAHRPRLPEAASQHLSPVMYTSSSPEPVLPTGHRPSLTSEPRGLNNSSMSEARVPLDTTRSLARQHHMPQATSDSVSSASTLSSSQGASQRRPHPNPLHQRQQSSGTDSSYSYMPGSTFNNVGGGQVNYTSNVNSHNNSSITQTAGQNGQNIVGSPRGKSHQ